MPQAGNRRKRSPRRHNVIIVPTDEGGKTRAFRTSPFLIAVLVLLGFLVSVAFTIAVLVFTPLAIYVPIPNRGLEERYGRQLVEMQNRLSSLADNIVVLTDFNAKLRKALGEGGPRDTSAARNLPKLRERQDQGPETRPLRRAAGAEPDAPGEDLGVLDVNPGAYTTVSTAAGPARTSFPLLTPVDGFVTQGFDPSRNHFGMDIAGRRGTLVHAPGDGIVLFAGWTYDDGNMLIISHGGGYLTVYKHNQSLLKSALSGVRRGEPIALLGSSGVTSLGPHLHFELWKNGIPQDPNDYLLAPARTH